MPTIDGLHQRGELLPLLLELYAREREEVRFLLVDGRKVVGRVAGVGLAVVHLDGGVRVRRDEIMSLGPTGEPDLDDELDSLPPPPWPGRP